MKEPKYFTLKELVPPEVYNKLGRDAWRLFDQKLLDTIDFIRESLGLSMTVNNWSWGGEFKYRGFRPIDLKIGAKYSAHKEGKAVDFDVKGMSAADVRAWLINNADKLPYPIRMEADVNWVHIDVREVKNSKVYIFNP